MKHAILSILLGFLAAVAGVKFMLPAKHSNAATTESVHERVLRTGELRCGYFNASPYFMKDVATGTMSGIWHDFTEAMGKVLYIKIIWAEEVGLGDIPAALNAGRIDMYCGGLWTPGARIRVINYLDPTAFEPMLVYVRANDHRFDNDLSLINSPNIKISTIDGEGGGLIANEEFPKATKASLPQLSNRADMFNQVVFNKADVFINSPASVAEFNKSNPGKLRAISDKPLRVYPVSLAVKNGEDTLRHMLNMAARNVMYNGEMDRILRKYESIPGHDFWRVNPAYLTPKE